MTSNTCATCHFPPGFVEPVNTADPLNNVVSLGSDTSLHGSRNAPTITYSAFSPPFQWLAVPAGSPFNLFGFYSPSLATNRK